MTTKDKKIKTRKHTNSKRQQDKKEKRPGDKDVGGSTGNKVSTRSCITRKMTKVNYIYNYIYIWIVVGQKSKE